MCDYSVVAKHQRDYRKGEELVITQLGGWTKGTASPSDLKTAVCLRDQVCLTIPKLPWYIRSRYHLPKGETNAIFMQLQNREDRHRDALMFENGRTTLITELPVGMRLFVRQEQQNVAREPISPALMAVGASR